MWFLWFKYFTGGAGYIQLTHDYTYKSFASYIGEPKIVSEGYEYVAKNYAWDAAVWFWTEYKNIDDLIDKGIRLRQ